MRYESLRALDRAIENRIKRNVKHYKTDWTKYDRPKYNRCKGSHDVRERELLLIARECGTYLFTKKEIQDNEVARQYISYYKEQRDERNKFYIINLDKCSIILQH